MKKRILAFSLVLVMIFLLCGCDALDELRSQRAKYVWKDIVFQDVTYKKLPICPALNPELDNKRPVYVVDPEVPLLLITTEADATFYRSVDGNFLLQRSSEAVYVREDMYEQLNAKILKGWEYTKTYYEYMKYDENWDYEMKIYTLTQEQVEALEFLTQNVEPTTMEDGMYMQRDWTITLQESSEDGYFVRSGGKIVGVGRNYYLVIQDGKLRDQYFKVPDGLVSTFDDITEAYFSTYETDIEIEQNA